MHFSHTFCCGGYKVAPTSLRLTVFHFSRMPDPGFPAHNRSIQDAILRHVEGDEHPLRVFVLLLHGQVRELREQTGNAVARIRGSITGSGLGNRASRSRSSLASRASRWLTCSR
jgi:hypothetical protein